MLVPLSLHTLTPGVLWRNRPSIMLSCFTVFSYARALLPTHTLTQALCGETDQALCNHVTVFSYARALLPTHTDPGALWRNRPSIMLSCFTVLSYARALLPTHTLTSGASWRNRPSIMLSCFTVLSYARALLPTHTLTQALRGETDQALCYHVSPCFLMLVPLSLHTR